MHPPRHTAPRPPSRRPEGASSAWAGPSRNPSQIPHPLSPAVPGETTAAPPPRLLDRLRAEIRLRHYSGRTEAAYVDWARRFILFHGKRHPQEMGAEEVARFLSHLASERSVSASTQNQAKAALLFLYAQVLEIDLPWLDEIAAARVPRRLPVVLTPAEVRALLHELNGPGGLVASLLYGTGMRLLEGLRLRVKDVEFERREIVVRDGKGGKDRVTVLPENLMLPLQGQLAHAKALHDADLRRGGADAGSAWLPDALAAKYPSALRAWGWQWVFPSPVLSTDPRSGAVRRHHLNEHGIQRAVGIAARRAGIDKRARRTCCATRSPRTCCRAATTSARCRNRWAMPT